MGKSLDTRGRVVTESTGEYPGNGSVASGYGRMADRQWDVQQYTGYAVGNNQANGWQRGPIIRGIAPTFRPAFPLPMYDPTRTKSAEFYTH